MKIVFLTPLFHPHVGGVEKHCLNLALNLNQLGHEVIVITYSHDPNLPTSDQYQGIEIIRITYPKIKLLGLTIIWWKMLKVISTFRFANIIHIHDVFIWYLPIRLLLPFKKTYITHHGWEGSYPIPRRYIFFKKISNYLTKANISIGRYIEIYYGIHSNLILYGAVTLKKNQCQLKPDRFKNKTINYLGRLSPDNGLEILFKAKELDQNININFFGNGEYWQHCQQIGQINSHVVHAEEHINPNEIWIISGYLSLLEVLSCRAIPIALCHHQLRKDYFNHSPFKKLIVMCESPQELISAIHNHDFKPIDQLHKFLSDYSWHQLSQQYLKLWVDN